MASLLERLFGTTNTVKEAREAANDVVTRIEPIVLHVEHRLFGGLHGLLTRLNGTTLTLNIPPQPYPGEDAEIRKGEKVE